MSDCIRERRDTGRSCRGRCLQRRGCGQIEANCVIWRLVVPRRVAKLQRLAPFERVAHTIMNTPLFVREGKMKASLILAAALTAFVAAHGAQAEDCISNDYPGNQHFCLHSQQDNRVERCDKGDSVTATHLWLKCRDGHYAGAKWDIYCTNNGHGYCNISLHELCVGMSNWNAGQHCTEKGDSPANGHWSDAAYLPTTPGQGLNCGYHASGSPGPVTQINAGCPLPSPKNIGAQCWCNGNGGVVTR